MFLFDFLPDEHERIANLQDTEASCAAYRAHYKQLSPEEAAIAGYMLCAAGKQYVEGYGDDIEIIYPFDCVAQNDVNGGWGQMFSINPDCFVFPEDATLFYIRDTQPFIWNATNLSPMVRGKQIKLFTQYHASTRIIYLETDWQEQLRRNAGRPDAVPEQAIFHMMEELVLPEAKEAHSIQWICV